ncbi:MAG: phosphatase [Actinomycetota bacterium]
MDVIESHVSRLPHMDDRWNPQPFDRRNLVRGLVDGGIAGPMVGHPMENVLGNIRRLLDGDEDKLFGMSGLAGAMTPDGVLGLVGRAAGFEPDPEWTSGPVPVDPNLVLDGCEAVGDRLALACRRRERMILATGHPVGLAHLYVEVGRQLRRRGAELLQPYEGVPWSEEGGHELREVRFLEGVAMLADQASMRHTHSGAPMFRMLRVASPDLVFADHGFAGAAIESGVETLSIADVNDPALLVAKAQGRTQAVIVMDDNVQPEDYWPCFQAICARLP